MILRKKEKKEKKTKASWSGNRVDIKSWRKLESTQ